MPAMFVGSGVLWEIEFDADPGVYITEINTRLIFSDSACALMIPGKRNYLT